MIALTLNLCLACGAALGLFLLVDGWLAHRDHAALRAQQLAAYERSQREQPAPEAHQGSRKVGGPPYAEAPPERLVMGESFETFCARECGMTTPEGL